MNIFRRMVVAALAVVLILAAVVAVKTALVSSKQAGVEPVRLEPVDERAVAEHLSRAVQFKTISHQDPKQIDREAFLGLRNYLTETFPEVHRKLRREVVGEFSLLYTWNGSDPSLKPVVLMAHMDVVPVDAGTEGAWTEPPFSGRIADGYIWGRGTRDDKGSVMGLLEAAELLVKDGFHPKRTLYLAFGHDEEVAGTGAEQIVALLQSRGVAVEYVLDEGGSIFKGMIPWVSAPVAMVGVAEKGFLSIQLVVTAKGGHSSMPPPHTAIGALASALTRLERHQMPTHFAGLTEEMLTDLAPAARMPGRTIFANTWLLGPIIATQMARSPESNASIRTTTAETIVEGGVKDNVLPIEARAVVNFRILPGDTVESVLGHVRRVIDDPAIRISTMPHARDPSGVSSATSPAFKTIERTIREIFPEVAVVTPYLVLGATDSRHYEVVSRNIYRFTPETTAPNDLERVHGTNERLSVEGYAHSIGFFARLMRNSDQL